MRTLSRRPRVPSFVAGLIALCLASPAFSGYTEEERHEIDELEQDLRRFRDAGLEFRRTVTDVVKRTQRRLRDTLAEHYGEAIRIEEEAERARRDDAIALYEGFLEKHPDDRRWTPDVMLRLAELYFERSNDDYMRKFTEYEIEMARFDRRETEVVPTQPAQNYDPSIQLYLRLSRQFPDYGLLDGALYLLGYCLGEQGMETTARRALLALVCANHHEPPVSLEEEAERVALPLAARGVGPFVDPYAECEPLNADSRFIAEAWTRIGELHFDYNQIDLAIAAYSRVLADPESPYYDKALYKLAWSYYRSNRFEEAVNGFDALVVHADARLRDTGRFGSDLRAEAVQYLAVCFAEDDWDGDALPDTETGIDRIARFYAGREDAHVAEVYGRLADVYFDVARYAQARAVYKLALSRWPHARAAPQMQERVIISLERERRFDEAIAEHEEFTRLFGPGSDWYERNRDDQEAIARARQIDRQSLLQTAAFRHSAAQELRRQCVGMEEAAKCASAAQEYGRAATAYRRFLERFPDTHDAYELRYYLAESHYYASQFREAAEAYEMVRDSNLDNIHQADAAFNAIKAWEEHIAEEVGKNRLPSPPVPTPETAKAPISPIDVPEPYRKLQSAYDEYVRVFADSDKAATLSYKAAEIPFRFLRFDEARPRLEAVTERFCESDVAVEAFTAIVASYAIESMPAEAGRWGGKMAEANCGTGARASEAVAKGREIETSAAFAQAKQLFDGGQFEGAARLYIQLIDANPKHKDAPAALNNAAVAYENVHRFESATRLYERMWREYPESEFADYAIFRAAVNYQRFFEFEQAVANYLILVDNPKYEKSEHRGDALFNAAQLLASDQAYARAAGLFKRHAASAEDADDAAESYFRAAKAYEKANDLDEMTAAFLDFQKRFGDRPKQAARVVEAMFKMGQAYEAQGQVRIGQRLYEQTVAEFAARRLAPASEAAEFAAHAAFLLAEAQFRDFQNTKITGSLTTLSRRAEAMAARARELSRLYQSIWRYKRAPWTLAAMAREGSIYEAYARAYAEGFRTAPMPADLKSLMRGIPREEREFLMGEYQTKVDEALAAAVTPLEQRALKLYDACLSRAAEFGVSNEWTSLARARLNAYEPEKYPLLKEEKVELVLD